MSRQELHGRARAVVVTAALAMLALATAACVEELDPPWQLDHDRIVAVRATPPALEPGGRAELDALLSLKGAGTSERAPELAVVVSPMSLAGALAPEGGKWIVTAPDAAAIEAARAELRLRGRRARAARRRRVLPGHGAVRDQDHLARHGRPETPRSTR